MQIDFYQKYLEIASEYVGTDGSLSTNKPFPDRLVILFYIDPLFCFKLTPYSDDVDPGVSLCQSGILTLQHVRITRFWMLAS